MQDHVKSNAKTIPFDCKSIGHQNDICLVSNTISDKNNKASVNISDMLKTRMELRPRKGLLHLQSVHKYLGSDSYLFVSTPVTRDYRAVGNE